MLEILFPRIKRLGRCLFFMYLFMVPGISAETVVTFPDVTGWSQTGEIQVFLPENLYEYINGAADLYLSYDFQDLEIAEYTNMHKATVLIEIYRFNNADKAFGIYSQERPPEGDYLVTGAQGYREGPLLNFISGNFYVKISGTDIPDSATAVINLFARLTAEKIGGNPVLPVELKCFPPGDMQPYSEKFINRNFLGYNFLHSAFTADYRVSEQEYKLFIIKGRDEKDCAQMVMEFRKRNTGQTTPVTGGDYRFTDTYLGKVQFTWRQRYIWGVVGLEDTAACKQCLIELAKNVNTTLLTPVPVQQNKPELDITFPADRDTVESSRVRLAAWVSDTSASVTINDKILPVYPSGAVVSLMDLHPGWNNFVLTARVDSISVSDTLRVYRIPPLPALAEIPTAFGDQFMLPGNDIVFYAPDQLVLQFMGSPGGSASFEIGDFTDDLLPMIELSTDESNGIQGLYHGIYRFGAGDHGEKERLIFYLRGKDNKRKKWKTNCFITVRQTGQPFLVETAEENNLVYYQPDSEIFMELPRGIRMELIADYGRWLKVKISATRYGYIRATSAVKIGYGPEVPQARCSGFSSRINQDWLIFTFNITQKVPFRLRQCSSPQSMELTFYNTGMQDEWSTLPEKNVSSDPNGAFLKTFEWQQTADGGLQFRFFLNTEQQWGFRGRYEEKGFSLALRRPPPINSANPFQNLIIAVDAGHGGNQYGAVGATGYMEKTANLIYANFLAQMLREAGSKVILTRTADTTINLKPRADLARQYNAHILVWLHNNSVGASGDPLAVKGTSTYYTQQQGESFTQYVYPELLKLGLAPVGRVHRSYYITRQSDMIVFLVEGAFLSNPEDEIFLMNENNLKKLAGAVFQGMKKYLLTLVK
jgi:N-acetylmuramoyl-L-alanine amidase